jgi:hypothetical protein
MNRFDVRGRDTHTIDARGSVFRDTHQDERFTGLRGSHSEAVELLLLFAPKNVHLKK